MIDPLIRSSVNRARIGRRAGAPWLLTIVGLALTGCGALNPGFLDLLDTAGTAATIENASGHLVVTFINNAEVDERLIDYLESAEGGNLLLTEVEKRALRPRVRFRVLVTFADGAFQTVEFVNGSVNLVDQNFDAQAFPDLNQNDLDNVVVRCDVARVELLPNSAIEVFVPVQLTGWQFVEFTNIAGGQEGEYQQVLQTPPQFRSLLVDLVDQDGNTTLLRNIGVRDVPSPVTDPLCGSVIAIVLNGVVSVPFLDGVADNPSYDVNDAFTLASIGGRFEFTVSVQ